MKKTYQQPMAYIDNMELEQMIATSPTGTKIGDGFVDPSKPGLSRGDGSWDDEAGEDW